MGYPSSRAMYRYLRYIKRFQLDGGETGPPWRRLRRQERRGLAEGENRLIQEESNGKESNEQQEEPITRRGVVGIAHILQQERERGADF
jgi:hypothetical protein